MNVPHNGTSTQHRRADIGRRMVAAMVDGFLVGIIAIVPLIGPLIAAAYLLVRDGLNVEFMKQQSLGKKAVGIHAVRWDGKPADLATSITRNLPLAIIFVAPIFGIVPGVGRYVALLIGLIGIAVGVWEIVLVLTDPQGFRLGDKLARTRIVLSQG